MVTMRSSHDAAATSPAGTPLLPIEQQISAAIASGFEVVLKDVKAIHREMVAAHRDMVRGAETVAKRMDVASKVGPGGGLRSPSAHVGAEAASIGSTAHAMARTSEPASHSSSAHRGGGGGGGGGGGSDVYESARSVEHLRERVGQRIASTAQNYLVKPGTGLFQDAHGEWYRGGGNLNYDPTSGQWKRKDGTFASGAEIAAQKVVSTPGYHQTATGRWVNSTTKRFASAEEVKAASKGWDEVAGFQHRMQLSNTVGAAAEAFGSGQPVGRALMSMLPEGLAKGAGYAGIAYEAVNKGMEFAQGQYQKNRNIQQYLGGSNAQAFGERIARFTNNLEGKFSLLGPENYNELFDEATKLGERGKFRQETIGEGARIMGGGANIDQTMKVIETARLTGQSLSGLATAIAGVNKVARESMVSAAAARDVFIQNYQVISSMMAITGSANGAKTAASAIAQSQASLGAAYSSGVDYTGTYNTNMQYYLAAKQGMSYPNFLLAQTKNPGFYQAAVGQTVQQVLDQLTPPGKKSIRSIVGTYLAAKGGKYVSEIDAPKLFTLILQEGYQPIRIQQALARFGINTQSEKEAMAVAVQQFTTESAAARSVESQKAATEKYSTEGTAGTSVPRDIALGKTMVEGEGNRNYRSRDLYATYIDQTKGSKGKPGQRYPVVEELLRRTKDGTLSTGAKVIVQTASGGRVVSLSEAIKSFPDQLQNGSASLVDDNLNSTVGDYLGLPSGVTSETAASASTASKAGISEDEWRKKQSEAAAKKSSTTSKEGVLIDMTDEMKRYFKVISTTGTQTTLGASAWDGSSGTLPGVKP